MGNIDDQHRNPNMNDKDHLVGKLTKVTPETVKLGFSGSLPKYNHMSTGTAKLLQLYAAAEFLNREMSPADQGRASLSLRFTVPETNTNTIISKYQYHNIKMPIPLYQTTNTIISKYQYHYIKIPIP